MLSYSPNDFFSASVGRYHTGIGYYNTAYHHGTWFQTATGRPLIFAIDGDIGVIPIHTLGVSATGAIPSGSLGLHYVAEFGSGRAGQSSAAVAPQPALERQQHALGERRALDPPRSGSTACSSASRSTAIASRSPTPPRRRSTRRSAWRTSSTRPTCSS